MATKRNAEGYWDPTAYQAMKNIEEAERRSKMNFEQSLKRLDEIVKNLEKGDVSLADSMSLFEEGTALIKSCGTMLDEAEQKVVMLKKGADGLPEELPFGE